MCLPLLERTVESSFGRLDAKLTVNSGLLAYNLTVPEFAWPSPVKGELLPSLA